VFLSVVCSSTLSTEYSTGLVASSPKQPHLNPRLLHSYFYVCFRYSGLLDHRRPLAACFLFTPAPRLVPLFEKGAFSIIFSPILPPSGFLLYNSPYLTPTDSISAHDDTARRQCCTHKPTTTVIILSKTPNRDRVGYPYDPSCRNGTYRMGQFVSRGLRRHNGRASFRRCESLSRAGA
jgi:hypothetical protein